MLTALPDDLSDLSDTEEQQFADGASQVHANVDQSELNNPKSDVGVDDLQVKAITDDVNCTKDSNI